tara:strand:- start:312 stop:788 length:477 start_codon:yes stop_codon:yes gene_type:complete
MSNMVESLYSTLYEQFDMKDNDNKESIHIANESKNPIVKVLWVLLGSLLVVIAAIGIIIPGLPTTIFLILAAACYIRSSQKLYNWLIKNKSFGPYLKDYREGKGIPKKAKLLAITMIILFIGYAIFFGLEDLILRIVVGLLGLIGFLFVLLKVPVAKN